MPVDTGNAAPDFTLPADGGRTVSLSDFQGRAVVLYFYPKDMTPGCTTEAVDFRDLAPEFEESGAAVIGVSKDSVKRHDSFKAKHDLKFDLLSDTDGEVCEAYGVWVLKKLYGREYMGIERATFLIDETGTVRRVWRKVKVKGHAAEVLDSAREL